MSWKPQSQPSGMILWQSRGYRTSQNQQILNTALSCDTMIHDFLRLAVVQLTLHSCSTNFYASWGGSPWCGGAFYFFLARHGWGWSHGSHGSHWFRCRDAQGRSLTTISYKHPQAITKAGWKFSLPDGPDSFKYLQDVVLSCFKCSKHTCPFSRIMTSMFHGLTIVGHQLPGVGAGIWRFDHWPSRRVWLLWKSSHQGSQLQN